MRSKGFLLGCLLFFVAGSVFLFAQSINGDVKTKPTPTLEFSHVLESFDSGKRVRDWKAEGNRFVREGYPRVAYTDIYPKALNATIEEDQKASQRVMGVNCEWSRIGRNYFDVIPCELGTTTPSPIPFDGVVEYIDFWVWGSNYEYYLDICVEDTYGTVHRLPAGTLDYIGWQHKKVKVPHSIPQMVKHIPYTKPIKFVKFIVSTYKKERVDSFYVYFDNITYMTNNYNDKFDGDELIDQDKIQEIWGKSTGK